MLFLTLPRKWYFSILCLGLVHDVLADVPNPDPDNFLRRGWHSVAVVNDYLYIDGGSLSQKVGGVYTGTNRNNSWPLNDTLSISLKESWTNKSARFNVIPKPSAPVLDLAALWGDGDNNAFYMFGGAPTARIPSRDKNVWKFQGDGSGSGSWSMLDPANGETFSQIVRTYGASYASCHGTGFYLSGFIKEWVTLDDRYGKLEGDIQIPTPGLLTYNFESRNWENVSTVPKGDLPGLNEFGNQISGEADCVPSFGEKGIFMPIGGTFTNIGRAYNDDGLDGFQSMTEISFYDVASKAWYTQKTTSNDGDGPKGRDRLCITGAASLNGTYEIFLYGGYRRDIDTTFDDVWVLSLPAFRWFKGPSGPARRRHECATIGNRQMVIVGGFGTAKNTWKDPDEFSQGIAIFDMTSMTWSDEYDANAAPYDSPRTIKDWYNQGGLSSVEWTNGDVKRLFLGSNPGNNSEEYSKGSKNNPETSGSGTRMPIIVGASVGTVAGLVIIAAVLVYIRRKHRRKASTRLSDHSNEPCELEDTGGISSKYIVPQEMAADRTLDPQEILGNVKYPQEVSGTTISAQELDGSAHYPPKDNWKTPSTYYS